MKKSRFPIGATVEVTHNYSPFLEGDRVTVVNNEKKGALYTNRVQDRARGVAGDVPVKYLDD